LAVAVLHLIEEHHSALVEASENPLNELAAAEYSLIVPLDLEHPPVLLYVNGRLSLFLPVFLSLTIYKFGLVFKSILKLYRTTVRVICILEMKGTNSELLLSLAMLKKGP
jgi:hypothetical protein